ncbi:premnaspirodiene oxygenase-like [Nicotiana tomentosiformis]|uniref:premnaspirodiene oxygenase-like n=1 Tax=Nicotiana tomentosiformis TaxID=4098 RepID=UPI00051B7E18|nr:premnaspirodiene oxygenase-like [Nicotiana tomentosiformis]
MEVSFFIITIFLFFLPLLFIFIKDNKRGHNLPPGPWKLPMIGNLHNLLNSLPHVALKELAARYGPLMHLKLGERSTIIISSYQILKDVMRTSNTTFAERPELLVSKTIAYDGGDVAFAPYGDYWKQMRKICILQLLSPSRVHSAYPLMEEEIARLVKSIKASVPGAQINMNECLYSLTCNIICKDSVGMACSNPNSLISAMKGFSPFTGVLNVSDLFPSLEFLDQFIIGSKQKLLKLHQQCDRLLEEIVSEHEASIQNNNGELIDHEDLMHVLLRLRDKESHNYQVPITRNNIKAIVLDMFVGGTETVSTSMEWAMSELVKNPAVMKKVQAEVRETLKGKKIVGHSDIQNLKYLKNIVKETLRLHPPGPLSLPRQSIEQCVINGYVIPNKTIALVNLWAMGRDPQYWHNPEKFEPERFDLVDTKGIPIDFLAFGFGKRVCPGISFGVANFELILARLLYHFDWKLPNGMNPEELDMTETFGAAAARKNNLHLIASPYDY